MPRSGLVNTRLKPRVTVLRGFDPNAPMTLTQSLPAFTGVSSSTGIYSGQLISSAWDSTKNQHCWVLGLTGSVNTPYIALQDIADQDVSEAGRLTGLSCLGKFEIQTAYYTGSSIAVGALVVPSATLGSIAPSSATGQVILGSITRAPSGDGMTPSVNRLTSLLSLSLRLTRVVLVVLLVLARYSILALTQAQSHLLLLLPSLQGITALRLLHNLNT
jgi:hypothetical protein